MATVDWGLVAVVIALLAYPVQVLAVPALLPPIRRLIYLLPLSATYCETFSIEFSRNEFLHIYDRARRKCYGSGCTTPAAFGVRLTMGTWSQVFSLIFPTISAAKPVRVKKPVELALQKKYIRVDTRVILMYTHAMATILNELRWEEPETRFSAIIKLNAIAGKLTAQPSWRLPISGYCDIVLTARLDQMLRCIHTSFAGLSTAEYLANISGKHYSLTGKLELPLSDHFGCLERREITYPLRSKCNTRRGGWVLALGMAYDDCQYLRALSPLIPRFWYGQPVQSRFKRLGMAITMSQDLDSALSRVVSTLDRRMKGAFPDEEEMKLAVNLAREIVSDYEPWGPQNSARPIDYHDLFRREPTAKAMDNVLGDMESEICERLIGIFNSNEPLTLDEIGLIRPILLRVCRAPIKGLLMAIYFWLCGTTLIVPEILLEHDFVYLEDN